MNNGTCRDRAQGLYECKCPADNPQYFGQRCELLQVTFNGQGWSLHPGLPACDNSHLSMLFNTGFDEGTLIYTGPSPDNFNGNVTDFLSIELKGGKLNMKINFGSGTKLLSLNRRVDDNKDHFLTVRWTDHNVQMELQDDSCDRYKPESRRDCYDDCKDCDQGTHHYINTNGPLHVGGVSFGDGGFHRLAEALNLDRYDMDKPLYAQINSKL